MKEQGTGLFAVERDLRFDLLRGVGLWMIFLDHIPDDVVSWLTLRNYGFCDAPEFFVFLLWLFVRFLHVAVLSAGEFLAAVKRLWLKGWQMEGGQIPFFLGFTA